MPKITNKAEFSNGVKTVEKGMVIRAISNIESFYNEKITLLSNPHDCIPSGEVLTVSGIIHGAFGSPFIAVTDKYDKEHKYIAVNDKTLEYICG